MSPSASPVPPVRTRGEARHLPYGAALSGDRDLDLVLAWVVDGTALFEATAARADGELVREPSALPGWSRAHVIAHVARNADALVNLLTWARTGVPTPMYADPEQRAADIEAGAGRPADELLADLRAADDRLADALRALPAECWTAGVRTARGRAVPASEVPWMRTREVWVHAVDLDAGTTFADLPSPVTEALLDDAIRALAARDGVPRLTVSPDDLARSWTIGPEDARAAPVVGGDAAAIAAHVLGRPARGGRLTMEGAQSPPPLPPWL